MIECEIEGVEIAQAPGAIDAAQLAVKEERHFLPGHAAMGAQRHVQAGEVVLRGGASQHRQTFAREISAAFDHIADAAERYGKNQHVKVIRVSASATVAMRWLIPLLPRFAQRCPDVDVRVSTAMSTEPGLRGSFDVAIRPHVPPGGQFQSWPLFRERNTVIASPQLIARTGLTRVEQLAAETWLTSETRPGDWEAWLSAIGQADLRANRTLRFDHFFVTLQAVVDGLGFGIGPFPTLESDCVAGRVQKPFPDLVSEGATYHALVPLDADKPVHMRDCLDWLQTSGMASSESARV